MVFVTDEEVAQGPELLATFEDTLPPIEIETGEEEVDA